MAALLRQGARRIGGSVIQRTQAALTSLAVAEERRLLVPRRMYSAGERPSEKEVLGMKEELYEALSKGENIRNRGLLQDLAVHVNPKPEDPQWSRLKVSRRFTNFAEATGTVVFVSVVVLNAVYETFAAEMKPVKMEREYQVKLVAVEGENEVETD